MNIERTTINLDMDGVLAGFDQRIDQIAVDELGLEEPEFRSHFYASKNYPPKHIEAVRAISNEKGFFGSLPVIHGAIDGIQRVIDAGYHPRILSSPIGSNPYSTEEKLEWLEEHIEPTIGSFIVSQAVITKDKHLFDGAALIDDRPQIKHSEEAAWEHVLFTQEYNEHISGKLRIDDWYDPNLEEVLRIASARSRSS